MVIHPFHPVVLIIGVLFALRRLNVSMQVAEQYPGADAEAFARWKLQALRAYGLGMSGCFGKVLLDYLVFYLFHLRPPPMLLARAIGISLDVGWVVLVALAYVRVRKAHALAREIGVEQRPEK